MLILTPFFNLSFENRIHHRLKTTIRTFTAFLFLSFSLSISIMFFALSSANHMISQANPYYFPHLSIIYCSRFCFCINYTFPTYIAAFIFHFLLFWVKQRTSPEFKTFFLLLATRNIFKRSEEKTTSNCKLVTYFPGNLSLTQQRYFCLKSDRLPYYTEKIRLMWTV